MNRSKFQRDPEEAFGGRRGEFKPFRSGNASTIWYGLAKYRKEAAMPGVTEIPVGHGPRVPSLSEGESEC